MMATNPEEIRGTICDELSSEPIAGVVIRTIKSKGKPVSFSSSSQKGSFTIKITEDIEFISFRSLGYKQLTLPVTYDFSKPVRLTPHATQLNDVIVEAPDIYARGDTLVFNVAKYANAKDNAIIDVIKRLPGIKVEDDGTIKYQGKPINKFYIDGNDFLDGQYGVATENISHKDVKSVEVMEHHQPVKALEGIEFPEEAGINLKLKDDAKGRWVGVAQGSTGATPLLYDGSLFLMRMAKKIQNIFTVRYGNTGWNPASQIREHDFNDMFSHDYRENQWLEYISADNINPPLSEKRTRDNLSWIANSIMAWKRGDTSMRLKLNCSSDRLDYNSGVKTDYFSSAIQEFVQKTKQRTQSYDLSAQFKADINKPDYFLKEKLRIGVTHDHSISTVNGSFELAQVTDRKNLSVVNDLKLVKRNEKRLFELTSRNSFHHSPDKLSVIGTRSAIQTVGFEDFRSTTETQFGKLSRFWKFYMDVAADLNYRRLNLKLSGMADFDNYKIYNAFLSEVYASPRIDYNRNNWRISVKATARWVHHTLNGNEDYINLSPRLSIFRTLTSKSELAGSLGFSLSPPEAFMNIDVPVLEDYRNLFIGKNYKKYSHNYHTGLEYRYRNPLDALFFNSSLNFSRSSSSSILNQLFIEDFIISTYSGKLNHCDTWAVNAGFSKGLGHSRMVIGFDINGSKISASSMRDNIVTPYNQLTVNAKPFFRGSLARWFSLNYESNLNYSLLKIDNESTNSYSLKQNLNLTFLPHDCCDFTIGADHFLTRFPGRKDIEATIKNLILLDASVDWRVNGRIRLSLKAYNILNKRTYSYITYGTLSRSEHTFKIRPLNIILTVQYRF